MAEFDKIQIVAKDDINSRCESYGSLGGQNADFQNSDRVSCGSSVYRNTFPKDPEFEQIVQEGEKAIMVGFTPVLSSKGTSGCYFIQDRTSVSLGVANWWIMLLKCIYSIFPPFYLP